MFMYNGYYLTIFPDKDVPTLLHGECSEVNFYYLGESYDTVIEAFKKQVHHHTLVVK